MPSPQRLYSWLTDAELAALRTSTLEQLNDGRFTSLSGAQKSSSREYLAIQTQLLELKAELDYRAGRIRPQKVLQILQPGYYPTQ